jgi:ABC-type transporter Mla MlaB component
MATLDPVDVGDHVCWQVGPGDDFSGTARAFSAHGALVGDKVLILGSVGADEPPAEPALRDASSVRCGADAAVGPGAGADDERTRQGVLGRVRREAEAASREGFRALRVLARWDQICSGRTTPDAVARHELTLDALVAEGGTIVVCAYPRTGFSPAALDQAASVHPHHLGTVAVGPAFRLFSGGKSDCWSVSGLVDTEGAAAFGTAMRELLTRCGTVRLECEKLEWMDAAGMSALVRAARDLPGCRVRLSGANQTVRRVWDLLGYDTPLVPVELAP